MAKKTNKSPQKKKPAKAKGAPKKKAAPRSRITSPKSQPLPGMEQVTNKTLNRICEHISDVRREMNRARADEKDLMNQAIRVMTADKVTVYRFSGVELVLVPGDVHLRVRTLKDTPANTNAPKAAEKSDDEAVTAYEMQTPDDERLAEQDDDPGDDR